MSRVACAVLAAGASRRLGSPKQLVPFRGVPLVRHVMEVVCASACERVALVVGARGEEIGRAVLDLRAAILVNDGWAEGLASSIRVAVRWAEGARADALVLALGDQPYVDASHLDALVCAHLRGAAVVASSYAGVRGVPALFGRASFPALRALTGDRGASALLRAARDVATVPCPRGDADVDTAVDVARLGA